MPSARLPRLLAVVLAAWAAAPAQAQERGTAVFVQGGVGEDRVRAVSAGLAWDLPWRRVLQGTELSARAEVFVSDWRSSSADGAGKSLAQLGVVPLLRVRPAAGRSPWFIEGGIGIALVDRDVVAPRRTFGTRLDFSDNLALGRYVGAHDEQEWSVRLQHTSNAGIRKPNPGLDFLLVRYAVRF